MRNVRRISPRFVARPRGISSSSSGRRWVGDTGGWRMNLTREVAPPSYPVSTAARPPVEPPALPNPPRALDRSSARTAPTAPRFGLRGAGPRIATVSARGTVPSRRGASLARVSWSRTDGLGAAPTLGSASRLREWIDGAECGARTRRPPGRAQPRSVLVDPRLADASRRR